MDDTTHRNDGADRAGPDLGATAPASPVRLALAGLLALAAAMGVGRFAATPLIPLMQASQGLTLAEGAWLATANYAGYLAGALLALVAAPSASRATRWGLVAVALTTAAMALASGVLAWCLLRFVAGVASALVLVGVSGTALSIIGAGPKPQLTGVVFAGVGVGSMLAGLIAMGVATMGGGAVTAWWLLAGAVAVATLAAWRSSAPMASARSPAAIETGAATTRPGSPPGSARGAWALVLAYGSFGLGYIVPATFLPAMARALFDDPLVYGWLWPLFGLAAAISTVVTTWRFRRTPPQTVFIASLVIMAIGVILPALGQSALTLALSALCVGGTFMVATMAGLWRARELVDGPPFRLIAAMTAAFAAGQLLGPALVALGAGSADPIALPSLAAGVLLLASAVIVRVGAGRGTGPRAAVRPPC